MGIAVMGWLIFSIFIPELYLPILPLMLIFFILIEILTHAWQLYLARKDLTKFTRFSMMITFIRLVIYSLFAIIYIAVNSENAIVFIACLMVIYFVFNYIEVRELSRFLKKK